MTSRLQNLHSLYSYLNNAYRSLPLVSRRFLCGNHAQTTQEIRALARAKFVLAATLQWMPPNWCYDIDSFAGAMGRVQMKGGDTVGETEDELCPIWLHFFSDMVQLDRLLMLGQEDVSSTAIEILFIKAEEKYTWLDSLFQAIVESGGWEAMPNSVQLSQSMIFAGWNRFCFRVSATGSLEHAMATIRPTQKVYPVMGEDRLHAGKNSQREYFAFHLPIVDKPWALYKDSSGGYSRNYSPSGPHDWHCWQQDSLVERYETPSYAAGYYSVEEAFEANQLFDGRVYKKNKESSDPGPVIPTAITQAYEAGWNYSG